MNKRERRKTTLVEDETVAEEAPVVEEEAPALSETLVAAPANCTGELLPLFTMEGVTYKLYQCATCGQVIYVGFEDVIPTEHSPLIN